MTTIKSLLKKNFYQHMVVCMVWLVEMSKVQFNIWKTFNQLLKIQHKITFSCNKTLKVLKTLKTKSLLKTVIIDNSNMLKDLNREKMDSLLMPLKQDKEFITKKVLFQKPQCVKDIKIEHMKVLLVIVKLEEAAIKPQQKILRGLLDNIKNIIHH